MKSIKLLLFIGLLNIYTAFFIAPNFFGIFNIIAGWTCLFDAFSEKSIWKYIFNKGDKSCKE